MTIKVNIGPQPPKEEDEGVDCKCTRDSWPLIILITGFVVAFLVCLNAVLSLMSFEGVPQVVLDIYLIILALIGLEAEFRRFKFLRSIIYTFVIKYFYFLTNYYVRGAYYIFMGSILLGDKPLNVITGCVCMGLGIVLIGVHAYVGLPIYKDWQEEALEKARAEAAVAAKNSAMFRTGNTPGAHDHTQPAGAVPPPAATPAYQSPTVPPVDNTNRNSFNHANATNTTRVVDEREPEVPSARRMHTDDDLQRQYYAQQQENAYSPRDTYGNTGGGGNGQSAFNESGSNAFSTHNQPAPPASQAYHNAGTSSGSPSYMPRSTDNPFDAADEYQPPRF